MSGQYIINPLEPKEWSDNTDDVDEDAPEAFRKATRLSQHISYLKDFFRVYKDFNDAQIDSSIILASQNIEDFLLPEIKEFTKPLFSIPTHQFLFNGGNINARDYIDALQLEESEFDLIKYPERGTCLFKCGNERYLLQVKAPDYKAKLFGEAGGR